jgi:sarcosine oxidase
VLYRAADEHGTAALTLKVQQSVANGRYSFTLARMPSKHFDAIVLGLGAMGSAAVYQLAKAGKRVLGIDRYRPPHTLGSSHGQSRIIREAYFEHPLYVPLVQRAYELWDELEQRTGRTLFRQTGGLMIGHPEGVVFSGAKRSAEQHRLRHEVLSSAQVRARFPAFQPAAEMGAIWEPRAGLLFPEICIDSHLKMAASAGATLNFDEAVDAWQANGSGVEVKTQKGRYNASQLVCCAGAWMPSLLADLKLPLVVERQILFWFEAKNPSHFAPESCPIYIWEHERGRFFYGFPDLGEGVKVAGHHEGEACHPDQLDRAVKDREIEAMRSILNRFLPSANGALRSTTVCMYTDTPDQHFLIDWHPACRHRVLIASPCSGHGFKFSSAVGEVLADLLLKGNSRFDLSLFSLDRLKRKS